MWGKNSSEVKPASSDHSDITTLISGGTEIEGDVRFRGNVHVEGVIKGNITSDSGMLQLVKGSTVTGNIRASDVRIDGLVNGDVYASDRLELSRNAEINGNIYYDVMEMVAGAAINGRMERMHKSGELLPKEGEAKKQQEPKKVGKDKVKQLKTA